MEKALEFAKKALKVKEQTLSSDHPDLATSYNNISMIYYALGRLEEALEFAKKALEIYEQTLSSDHPLLATSYNR